MIKISSGFDAGNIAVEDIQGRTIDLKINNDNHSHFYQWFYFRLTGGKAADCMIRIMNAKGAAYVDGWPGYKACASYDRQNWFRVDTGYKDGILEIRHMPEQDAIYYAYFAPYSMKRHGDLIAKSCQSPRVKLHVLGATLDGQDLDLLEIGTPGEGKPTCWIIARQHPGETMAEWWMEGFLQHMLDEANPVSKSLLDQCHFYVVPNMNPDGSRRGHLRTNAAGANLNREWMTPTMERSPEVFLVRRKMQETGADFHLDVHGDEALPYNFIAGFDGIPSVTEKQLALLDRYKQELLKASDEFQTDHGYPASAPGKADLTMSTNYAAEHFGCLAMTLEMPFKDNADKPDPVHGWSPARCRNLAASCMEALLAVAPELR